MKLFDWLDNVNRRAHVRRLLSEAKKERAKLASAASGFRFASDGAIRLWDESVHKCEMEIAALKQKLLILCEAKQ